MQKTESHEFEYIDEDPLTVREFEKALSGIMSRTDRRRLWRALEDAGLIVFKG